MNNLDTFATAYEPNHKTALENNLILNWYPKRILNKVNHKGSILELGVGHGHTSILFNKEFQEHTIVEGSKEIINNFTKNNPLLKVKLVHEWFERFETEKRFDVIVLGFVLEHVDNPKIILEKYKKFLKPKGQLFIAVPNAKSLNRRYGLELGLINDIYDLNNNDIEQGHQRQYCLDSLTKEVQEASFIIKSIEGIYLKPLPLDHLKTLNNFEANLEAMLKVGVHFPELSVAILMEVSV
ncbi:class I SAM-dependent methyltransferase [Aliarcobacter skirrowii]|uniref:class I SAM-dependent methyltransferase n=1 Tax=Aliarcobacter skirrowii TaxID=28200 RepID=UPI0029BB2099|nr:class I SAM-dependent methyltransferase [Aliarcobacter skirrowii]MDX4012702.1 class I SAM-dependent methyltransferase [Aliarcobacter skirrowii]